MLKEKRKQTKCVNIISSLKELVTNAKDCVSGVLGLYNIIAVSVFEMHSYLCKRVTFVGIAHLQENRNCENIMN